MQPVRRRAWLGRLALAGPLSLGCLAYAVVATRAEEVPAVRATLGGTAEASVAIKPPPAALDVAVLIDATGSESIPVQQTTAEVAAALDAVIDAGGQPRVGIALSSDVPVFPFGVTGDVPYHLVRQPDPTDWRSALAAVEAFEGGGDDREGQLPAIAHLLGAKDRWSPDPPMTLRAGVSHVLLVTTDGPPHEATDRWCRDAACIDYPGPTTAAVQAMLAATNTRLVVLAEGDPGALGALARQTNGSVVAADAPHRVDQLASAIIAAVAPSPLVLRGCPSVAATFAPPAIGLPRAATTTVEATVVVAGDGAVGHVRCPIVLDGIELGALELDISNTTDSSTTTTGATTTLAPTASTATVPPSPSSPPTATVPTVPTVPTLSTLPPTTSPGSTSTDRRAGTTSSDGATTR